MLKKKFYFVPMFIILFFSCATDFDAEREIPEYNDALLSKIEIFIEEDMPERVIQLCSSVDDVRINRQKVRGIAGLEKKYSMAVEEEDYSEAAEIIKSLNAAGVETEMQTGELYLKESIKRIEAEELTPALAIFQNRIINSGISVEMDQQQVRLVLDAGLKNRSRVIVEYIRENYPDAAKERLPEVADLFEYIPDTEELISGTVTIWVNRGIRIERGIGYPDRVIGSGFYIDRRGYILTNYHVIASEVDKEYEGYSRLFIKYDRNEEKVPASVVGWDASLDIALLKVELEPDYFYTFAENREYRPGEKIFAIGSPGGLEKTITSGIISASGNRRLLPIGDTIQVDVPINSGNSGGPVVDQQGNLVGVVFAGIEQFEGVNFIIPVKWILNSLPELYKEGRNRQSWLGMTIYEDNDGIEIVYVMPGTSGFNSGIEQGDRIVDIDGTVVKTVPEAQEIIQAKKPGTLLNMRVQRDETEKNVLLIVEERDDMPMKEALKLDSRKNLLAPFIGMSVEQGDEKLLGQEYVIRKVYRGTAADETGLSINDPFSIVNWQIDEENDVIIIGIRIKKKKAGFLETVIQLGNYIDLNNTI